MFSPITLDDSGVQTVIFTLDEEVFEGQKNIRGGYKDKFTPGIR